MAIRFYTVEQLGEKQSLTPEGFLLCEEVPIARTGTMKYGPGETPIPVGPDGYVLIDRTDEEVFSEQFLASIVGKPVTIEHPPEDVVPSNYKTYATGTSLNPRRGSGMQSDLLIADLLITDPAAIRAIRQDGLREISVGYDAQYDEDSPGRGHQYDLIGNHVALVDSGRCGGRCSIGDHKFSGDSNMKVIDEAKKDDEKEDMKDKAKDTEGENKEDKKEEKDTKTYDAEATESRFKKIEDTLEKMSKSYDKVMDMMSAKDKAKDADEEEKEDMKAKDTKGKDNEAVEEELEQEAPEGHEKDARKARDSVYLEDSFQETVAQAEILVPGIRIPTFDKAASPKSTLDSICRLRRNALDLANNTAEGRGIIEEVNGKPLDVEGMSCGQVRNMFKAAVAIKKRQNSARTGDWENKTSAGTGVKGEIRTPAEMNKAMQEFWSNRS